MFDKIKQICVTVKSKVENGFGALVAALGVGAVMAASVPAHAEGLTVDYTTLTSSITSQLGPALIAALGIAGTILGIKFGYRFFRSFSKG